jgi:hypothetical protein
MTKAIIQEIQYREKNVFWFLAAALLLCVGLYIYCVEATVHNVVVRQNIENQFSQLSQSVDNAEFQYISMRNAITIDTAKSLGFVEVGNKSYVSKPSLGYLSVNSGNLR